MVECFPSLSKGLIFGSVKKKKKKKGKEKKQEKADC